MVKVFSIEQARRQRGSCGSGVRNRTSCPHRRVIAHRATRMVHCVACGVELDPFDVLLDLLQRIPAAVEDPYAPRCEPDDEFD